MRLRKVLFVSTLVFFLLAPAACSDKPSYENAEQFLRDFVSVLRTGQEHRFGDFYIQQQDFDAEVEGAALAIERFSNSVRTRFLANCRGAANLMRELQIDVEKIDLRGKGEGGGRKLAASFLKGVGEHYTDVLIVLDTGDAKILLLIKEVFQVEDGWRLTTFSTTVDTGTERVEPIEIKRPDDGEKEAN